MSQASAKLASAEPFSPTVTVFDVSPQMLALKRSFLKILMKFTCHMHSVPLAEGDYSSRAYHLGRERGSSTNVQVRYPHDLPTFRTR